MKNNIPTPVARNRKIISPSRIFLEKCKMVLRVGILYLLLITLIDSIINQG
ncbi:hypothetical protein VPH5P1C_0129 [Vibrio phage 5P1c]